MSGGTLYAQSFVIKNSEVQVVEGEGAAQITLDACTLHSTRNVACVTLTGQRSSLSMQECYVTSRESACALTAGRRAGW